MTRRRGTAQEAAARDETPAKMAPPHHALQPMEETPRGGDRSVAAASKLQRFAHTPQPAQGSPGCPVAIRDTVSVPSSPSAEDMQPQLSPMTVETTVREMQPNSAPAGDGGDGPTMRDIFSAVSTCNATLTTLNLHVGELKTDMAHVRQDLHNINERVQAAEERISAVEDQIPHITKELKRGTQQIAFLLNKVDDLENRLRRNNIRLVGVPEKSEGKDPVAFFESWLLDTVGKDLLSAHFSIERAHRVPLRPPPPGAPPRPILIKMLHFRDRDIALRRAREKGDMTTNGARVLLYPDFSGEIQRQRMQFQDIKKRLRALGVPYSMQYPAKLRVAALNNTHFFESPKTALTWLDANERNIKNAGASGS